MKLRDIKNKLGTLSRDTKDLLFLACFGVSVISLQALGVPENYVLYPSIIIVGAYILFTSPKTDEAEKKQESTLDRALRETSAQLKGVEALDNHFKKHPQKKLKVRNGKRKR